jgi:hypothetical protein
LNTATRGSRKEFPAVAVIVCETDKVTIHDGDDPDMPMWMVCTVSSNNFWIRSGAANRHAVAMNGIMLVGTNGGAIANSLLSRMDFLRDRVERHFDGGVHQIDSQGIIKRNNTFVTMSNGAQNIVSRYVNDVAMTVLPNAPIDSATGLPVPTIAVATTGGVSVIKDDGTVINGSAGATYPCTDVSLRQTGEIYIGIGITNTGVLYYSNYADIAGVGIDTFANADTFWYGSVLNVGNDSHYLGSTGVSINALSANQEENLTIASPSGITHVSINDEALDNGMVAYTTSDYNTGWMNGDIKLATLSDTDDTNVTGTELVTNGTFASDVSYWNGEQDSTATYDSGRLKVTKTVSSGPYGIVRTDVTTVVGKQYLFQGDSITGSGPSAFFRFNDGALGAYTETEGTTHRAYFTATTTNTRVAVGVASTAANAYIFWDNISVQEVEEDRSVNGKGLQVFGTVSKNPVATGADLVGYSGFGNGNYLKQPYNSDLDFGTGTFSITTWAKIPSVSSYSPTLVDRHVLNQARILLYAEYGNQLPRIYIAHTNGSTSTYVTGPTAIDDGVWHCWHANRRGNGELELWIDGVKVAYGGIGVDSISVSTNGPTHIGNDYTGGGTGYMNGDMALTRISETAPSPEQIKKIYEDEKVLFQENAKATLYGSSDAVTALAYDDDTELLHVGTSAGRSVFRGLRRIDNTTDAVGAAISASNGMVAED